MKIKKRRVYIKPTIEVVHVDVDGQFMSGSPAVQPGIVVVPPGEDDDEELSGAKKFDMWSE